LDALIRFLPAGDDDLAVREERRRVRALAVHRAEERILLAGEREGGHGGGDAEVHADVASLHSVPEGARDAALAGGAAALVHAVAGGIGDVEKRSLWAATHSPSKELLSVP